jgi:hypothetical protein
VLYVDRASSTRPRSFKQFTSAEDEEEEEKEGGGGGQRHFGALVELHYEN